jgi:hypothetical protein
MSCFLCEQSQHNSVQSIFFSHITQVDNFSLKLTRLEDLSDYTSEKNSELLHYSFQKVACLRTLMLCIYLLQK